jgi:large subunit ribosomal protein L7e
MNAEHFRQPKQNPAEKEKTPVKEKEEGKKEKKEKQRALGKGGKKLPAVPESVLKSRKRRDLAKAARVNVALKVISVIYYVPSSTASVV